MISVRVCLCSGCQVVRFTFEPTDPIRDITVGLCDVTSLGRMPQCTQMGMRGRGIYRSRNEENKHSRFQDLR